MPRQSEKYAERWDEQAQAPYLVNKSGRLVFGFENPRSLAAKCRYVQQKGMKGAMYWEYSGDDEQNQLRRTVWEGVLGTPIPDEQLQSLTLQTISPDDSVSEIKTE
jgi:GH18 family chitinase